MNYDMVRRLNVEKLEVFLGSLWNGTSGTWKRGSAPKPHNVGYIPTLRIRRPLAHCTLLHSLPVRFPASMPE